MLTKNCQSITRLLTNLGEAPMKRRARSILILAILSAPPLLGCTAARFERMLNSMTIGPFQSRKGTSSEPGISDDVRQYRLQEEQLTEWRQDFDNVDRK